MPPSEDAFVRSAKIRRHAAIVADANDLKSGNRPNGVAIDAIRRAERDALEELAEEYESAEDVDEIELPSERVGEYVDEDEDEGAGEDTGGGDEEPVDEDIDEDTEE